MPDEKRSPLIAWDHGTAWDFFASLFVIFTPGDYGLRASWAAGVRSRLSSGVRDTLGTLMHLEVVPVAWLHTLEEPKTARMALEALEAMAPEGILPALAINPRKSEPSDPFFREIAARGSWSQEERVKIEENLRTCGGDPRKVAAEEMDAWLEAWANPREFGLSLRAGLREFYEVFYRDEERRIAPDLDRARARAISLADRLSPRELFEELSQGIRDEKILSKRALTLVPCYWCSPRIIFGDIADDEVLVMFGARPADASLIPGDTVPARLLLALEALSDPTRLSILRAIIAEPLTQADIARRLRLRPPTISHHLQSLRIAGLVMHIESARGPTSYGARTQQIDQACEDLRVFLDIRIPESTRALTTAPTS